jgi:hypothetical protein
MVEDHFLDLKGAFGEMWTTSWRCMNCGRVHDSVIEQHQSTRPKKALAFPSGEPDYQDDEVHLGVESITSRAA